MSLFKICIDKSELANLTTEDDKKEYIKERYLTKLREIAEIKKGESGEPKKENNEIETAEINPNLTRNEPSNDIVPNESEFAIKAETKEEMPESENLPITIETKYENQKFFEDAEILVLEDKEKLELANINEHFQAYGNMKKSIEDEKETSEPLLNLTEEIEAEINKPNFESQTACIKEENPNQAVKTPQKRNMELRKLLSEMNSYYRILVKDKFYETISIVYDFENDKFFNYDKSKDYKDKENLLFIFSNKILENSKNDHFKILRDSLPEISDNATVLTVNTKGTNNIETILNQYSSHLSVFLNHKKLTTGKMENGFFKFFDYDPKVRSKKVIKAQAKDNTKQTTEIIEIGNVDGTAVKNDNKDQASNFIVFENKAEKQLIEKAFKTSGKQIGKGKAENESCDAEEATLKEIKVDSTFKIENYVSKILNEEETVITEFKTRLETKLTSGSIHEAPNVTLSSDGKSSDPRSLTMTNLSTGNSTQPSKGKESNKKNFTKCIFFIIDSPRDEGKEIVFVFTIMALTTKMMGF